MDEQVLRGLAKWPNVPAVYGWLGLDRRGNWLLQGEPIPNPVVNDYISRNYERDAQGRWFFQNGPQRVYVALEYTPFVYRLLDSAADAPRLEAHTHAQATALSGAWIDEHGALLLETEHGIGLVHDRDLELALPAMIDARGETLGDDALDEAIALVQQGRPALWLRFGASNVLVEPIASAEVPARFGFVARPVDPAQDAVAPAR